VGIEVCRALLGHPGFELVAAVDPRAAGIDLGQVLGIDGTGLGVDGGGLVVSDSLEALALSGTQVVVDFTRVEAARDTLAWCATAGIHTVVGTTGFTPEDLDRLRGQFAGPEAGTPNCILAPNFAIGAVLMMRFAELAAPWFDGAEIVELHHDGKLDAPSGTSLLTAERMATSRAGAGHGEFPPDRTTTVVMPGARGAGAPGGVHLHSVRLPGLVAHQEVILGARGQSLTIRHDSYDRTSFMDGVVLAVTEVANRPGLTIGIEPLLGL
jgi:4-hydroxy-tetrahydrodipicolinate reductase